MKKLSLSFFTTQNIAFLSLLSALTIILQLFGNFINFGFASINLSLIPIAIGALTLGPIGGFILGLLNGLVVLFSASTIAVFFPLSVFGTVVVCLLKTSVAGLVAGFIFLPFKSKKHEYLGAFLASICVPVINTLLFSIGFMIFFQEMAKNNGASNSFTFLIVSIIGINFIFEFLANSLLSSAIFSIYRYSKRKQEFTIDTASEVKEEINDDKRIEQK